MGARQSKSCGTEDWLGCCAEQWQQVPVFAGSGPEAGKGKRWVRIPQRNPWEIRSSAPVDSHPHLTKYVRALLELQWNHKATSVQVAPHTTIMAKTLKTHAVLSFNHHDRDRNGVLDATESKVFFAHYVDCLLTIARESIKNDFKEHFDRRLRDKHANLQKQGRRIAANNTKACLHQVRSHLDEQSTAYHKEEGTRFRQAFAVVDKNRDGCLQQQEVLDALTPGHPTNIQFHEGLGLQVDRIKVDVAELKRQQEEERKAAAEEAATKGHGPLRSLEEALRREREAHRREKARAESRAKQLQDSRRAREELDRQRKAVGFLVPGDRAVSKHWQPGSGHSGWGGHGHGHGHGRGQARGPGSHGHRGDGDDDDGGEGLHAVFGVADLASHAYAVDDRFVD